MDSGGGDRPRALSPPVNDGEFLLNLIRRPPHQPPMPPPQQQVLPPSQNLPQDPAVAAVGPTIRFPPIQSNDLNRASQSRPAPPFAPHAYYRGHAPKPSLNPSSTSALSSPPLADSFQKLDLSGYSSRAETSDPCEHRFVIGSASHGHQCNSSISEGDARSLFDSVANINGVLRKESKTGEGNWQSNRFEADFRNSPSYSRNIRGDTRAGSATGRGGKFGEGTRRMNGFEADSRDSWNSSRNDGNRLLKGLEADFQLPFSSRRNPESITRAGLTMPEVRRTPPGFGKKPSHRIGHDTDKEKNGSNGLREKGSTSNYMNERERRVLPDHISNRGGMIDERRLRSRLDCPGPPAGSTLYSASAFEIEESSSELHREIDEGISVQTVDGWGINLDDFDDLDEQVIGPLEYENGSSYKNYRKRGKDYRSDSRGQRVLSQRMRNFRRQIGCRSDIDLFSAPLLAIYESLTPPQEEEMKQRQLLAFLEKLVIKEWPEARLLVYGSCANSFAVSKSDIDICLAIDDADDNKAEVLLKLADILKSENLENVQALTHARVPIVKLMDPVTGISCDICVNNLLAVVNSKLLRDYAKIDGRLRHLAFIVKHWAKCRRVNETYHGTLSSYAYVLMCIQFLQLRRPAILPCLQGMDTTYAVTVDNIECAFFDQVDRLSKNGSRNVESIAQLVWAFFSYWAYSHDYANHVVSVRSGRIISKRDKDWTRRVGNDRHLICIEDPFEITHDLGRVVDRKSIKVLREEFERAAEILQYDPNPCVTLFEPYIP